jgi:hypothetical protein
MIPFSRLNDQGIPSVKSAKSLCLSIDNGAKLSNKSQNINFSVSVGIELIPSFVNDPCVRTISLIML